MEKTGDAFGRYREVLFVVFLLFVLYASSLYSILLLHTLVELFSIVIACGIFMLVWNSRRFMDNNYFLVIGVGFLFIAVMDLFHTLSYEGMELFQGYGSSLSTNLWIAARYVESLTFLIAPLFIGRRLKLDYLFSGYAVVISLLLASIFDQGFFMGSPLILFSGYIIPLFLLFSIYLLFKKRSEFDISVFHLLVASIFLSTVSNAAFAHSVDEYDFFILSGHFLKMVAYYLIYKAIIVIGLTRPYDLLFRNLKQSEESLQISRDYVQNIIDSVGDQIVVIDPFNYRIVLANKKMREWAKGVDPVAGSMTCYQFFFNRDTPCSDSDRPCTLKEVIETKAPVKITTSYWHDNAELFFDVIYTPIFNMEGEVVQVIALMHDVTEMKLEEKSLREKGGYLENYLEKLISSSIALIIVWDQESRIIRVNHAFEELTGYTASDLVNKELSMIFPPESLHKSLVKIERILSGEHRTSVEIPILCKDGSIRLIIWNTANIYSEDRTVLLAAIAQGIDMTEFKRGEEALQAAYIKTEEEKARSDAILRGIGDALNIVDTNFKVSYQNQIAKGLFGSHPDEYCYSAFRGEDHICEGCPVALAMKHGKIYSKEMTITTEEGTFDVDITSSPLKDSTGKIIGGIEVVRDLTDRRQAEIYKKYSEELKRSNELKELFTDILRHDLLNPAGIVKGYTEVLLEMEQDGKKKQSLQAIERNTQKLITMIENASKFAKLESVEDIGFEKLEIGVIFKGVVENFRPDLEEKQMVLEFAAEGTYPASVNPVIEDVFANLLSNAIKYSPKKSRIIIDILDAGKEWKVTVTDFGEGISDEDKSDIFERFMRAGKGGVKGTGLGLAIARRIIDLHGGSIGVKDNPQGRGSVFWVTVKKA